MKFKLRCPNGHKLRFDEKDVGKEGMCPTCKSLVTLKPRRPVSDTSIMAVLGKAPADHSVVMRPMTMSPPPAPGRNCPRCHTRVSSAFQLCPNCQTYLPPSCRDDL